MCALHCIVIPIVLESPSECVSRNHCGLVGIVFLGQCVVGETLLLPSYKQLFSLIKYIAIFMNLLVIIFIKIFTTEFVTILQPLPCHHVVHYQTRNHHVLYLEFIPLLNWACQQIPFALKNSKCSLHILPCCFLPSRKLLLFFVTGIKIGFTNQLS